jgi:hypothetical protein
LFEVVGGSAVFGGDVLPLGLEYEECSTSCWQVARFCDYRCLESQYFPAGQVQSLVLQHRQRDEEMMSRMILRVEPELGVSHDFESCPHPMVFVPFSHIGESF